jgi:hypothetical protein
MITIHPSPTADSRTCDPKTVTQEMLFEASEQHIYDVRCGLAFFREALIHAGRNHDPDKLTDIASFHADFQYKFAEGHNDWFDRHRKLNRHHLDYADGIPEDVNLIDVLEHITDCVMSGLARTGSVYPLSLSPELLTRAFNNTVELLKKNVEVEQKTLTPID